MKFWENLKEVIGNLPLVLSDTYDPRDISLNRISSAVLLVNAVGLAWYTATHLEYFQQLISVLDRVIAALGVQLGLVNMVKRGIDTYKDVKAPDRKTLKS